MEENKLAKILIIDDEEINNTILSALLTELDYETKSLLTAVNIENELKNFPADLILLDLYMPEQDGFETLEILQKSKLHDIPVIIISGDNSDKVISKCLNLGAIDFISKPYKRLELLARVSLSLKIRHLTESLNFKINELEKINQNVEQELQNARRIQMSITGPAVFNSGNLKVVTHLEIANQLGGDFFDIKNVEDDVALGVVADVSGHGVSSSLVVMMLKALMDTHATGFWSPSELLDMLHEELFGKIPKGFFVAINHFHFDKKDNILTFSNAGLYDLIVIRNRGEIEYFNTRCFALAFIKNCKYTEMAIKLEPGDKVIISTDGINEAVNKKNEMYGLERFKESIEKHHALNAENLLKKIFKEREDFIEDIEPEDDTTVMILEVTQNP